MAYCDHHRSGENIIVIEGRELILGEQGDVAQIVLHRDGDRLTVIDSGAYPEDRESILRAARQLGDVSHAVLLNSHGHVDHVGNNDVIYELAPHSEHYMPKKDYPNLCDQSGFFEKLMDEATRYLEMGSPKETVQKLMRLFPELRVPMCQSGVWPCWRTTSPFRGSTSPGCPSKRSKWVRYSPSLPRGTP